MINEIEALQKKLYVLVDILIVTFSFLATVKLREYLPLYSEIYFSTGTQAFPLFTMTMSAYVDTFVLLTVSWILMLYFNGAYSSIRTQTYDRIVNIIIHSAGMVFLVFITFLFVFQWKFMSRLFFIMFMAISIISFVLYKVIALMFLRHQVSHGFYRRRALVIGTGPRAKEFLLKIQKDVTYGIQIIGVLDYENEENGDSVSLKNSFNGIRFMGSIDMLPSILETQSVDEVIFIIPRKKLSDIEEYIHTTEVFGIRTTIAVDLFDLKIGHLEQGEIAGVPLITYKTTVGRESQLWIKRMIDIVVSGLGIIVQLPLFIFIAILIKVTSPGPILFRQKRIGLNNRKFVLYKFRSMYVDAPKRLKALTAKNEMDGPVFKIKDDPRITKVGKWLRKLSMDEMPQLFNVLVGHMSLVGPRPPLPKEVAQYKPWQRRRLSLRPGITCIWQISGRNNIKFEKWMRLDLQYIDNWSLWLDFEILIKTIPAMLRGSGAS